MNKVIKTDGPGLRRELTELRERIKLLEAQSDLHASANAILIAKYERLKLTLQELQLEIKTRD